MPLVVDRVAMGRGDSFSRIGSGCLRWRRIVWLLFLTSATKAIADLVPTTRVSHHLYAAIMLIHIFAIWSWENVGRLRSRPPVGDVAAVGYE